ncbi:MAG: hypothetical protein CL484_12170 [Acidobacteria bacterium]|nr:hypothetical protein [Acidobacteriota bacterium]|tara:strand:+ start:554 stop:859 length:306 start_codon:yes stop_codon:yes gene_type:complete
MTGELISVGALYKPQVYLTLGGRYIVVHGHDLKSVIPKDIDINILTHGEEIDIDIYGNRGNDFRLYWLDGWHLVRMREGLPYCKWKWNDAWVRVHKQLQEE